MIIALLISLSLFMTSLYSSQKLTQTSNFTNVTITTPDEAFEAFFKLTTDIYPSIFDKHWEKQDKNLIPAEEKKPQVLAFFKQKVISIIAEQELKQEFKKYFCTICPKPMEDKDIIKKLSLEINDFVDKAIELQFEVEIKKEIHNRKILAQRQEYLSTITKADDFTITTPDEAFTAFSTIFEKKYPDVFNIIWEDQTKKLLLTEENKPRLFKDFQSAIPELLSERRQEIVEEYTVDTIKRAQHQEVFNTLSYQVSLALEDAIEKQFETLIQTKREQRLQIAYQQEEHLATRRKYLATATMLALGCIALLCKLADKNGILDSIFQ